MLEVGAIAACLWEIMPLFLFFSAMQILNDFHH